jgi:hypothetical protein
MLTWKKFLEAKGEKQDVEEMEEKLHKDLDKDEEKGESKEHKEKVFGKKVKEKEEK